MSHNASEIKNTDQPQTLYHYTSIKGFHGIMESLTLWATHIEHLNDETENKYAANLASEQVDRLLTTSLSDDVKSMLPKLMTEINWPSWRDVCIFSLSEKPNLLGQWRAYCSNGGVSIGFNKQTLEQLAAAQKNKPYDGIEPYTLRRCIYNQREQEEQISIFFDQVVRNFETYIQSGGKVTGNLLDFVGDPAFEFLNFARFFKHPSFRQEKEWRLVSGTTSKMKWRSTDGMLTPYREFDLVSPDTDLKSAIDVVYVGPSPHQNRLAQSIELFLRNKICPCFIHDDRQMNGRDPKDAIRGYLPIVKSGIPFRSN